MTTPKKELHIRLAFHHHSKDDDEEGGGGGRRAYVDVSKVHSLDDVRRIIAHDWDEDMVPPLDYFFCVDGVRISTKQEGRKLAWDLVDRDVSLHEKYQVNHRSTNNNNNKRPNDTATSSSIAVSESKKVKATTTSLSESLSNTIDGLTPLRRDISKGLLSVNEANKTSTNAQETPLEPVCRTKVTPSEINPTEIVNRDKNNHLLMDSDDTTDSSLPIRSCKNTPKNDNILCIPQGIVTTKSNTTATDPSSDLENSDCWTETSSLDHSKDGTETSFPLPTSLLTVCAGNDDKCNRDRVKRNISDQVLIADDDNSLEDYDRYKC